MPKTRPHSKSILSRSTYRDAARLAEVLSNPRTPLEVRNLLQSILLNLSQATDVWAYHPALVRLFYVEATRALTEIPEQARDERTRIMHLRADLRNVLDGEIDRELEERHALPAHLRIEEFQPRNDSVVVDFLCWKQSHPRPIKTCAVEV